MGVSKDGSWRARIFALAASVLVSSFLCSAVFSGFAHAAAASTAIGKHVPAAVVSGQATRMAMLPSEQHLSLALNLPVANQAELDALLTDLYDPTSPNYHHYLSVDQYTARFAPTQSDYDAVVSWAKENGFTVTATAPNRRLVDVDGSVEVVNRALHLTMGSYKHPTENRQFFAPDREPTFDLPVRLLQVTGLDNFRLPHTHLKRGDATTAASPIAHLTGSGPSGEYLPKDMRAAYYGSGPLTGAGQTIGIFSFDGYKSADVTLYKTSTGMTFSTPITNVLVAGYSGVCDAGDGSGTSTCDDGEQVLDIVNAIGMAPGISQIIFYEGSSATNILNRMATDNLAKSLSCSWGGGDFSDTADDPIYQEMAAQGQTYANATGDSGAYNTSTWAPPSADPNVLEVGGTDLTTSGPAGTWTGETGWPDSGGGFISQSGENTPSYQKLAGVITATNKGSTTFRNDPDVAAEANFDNPTASNGSFETGFGGTSFAAPRWAGIIALLNQQSVANGHGTVGFVNPALYNLGVGGGGNFHDITSGNNRPTAGSGAGFNATTGYDLVTGWGSPNGPTLIAALAGGGTTPPADFSLSASPASVSVTQGSSVTSTITVGDLNGFTGAVSLTASGLPAGVTGVFSPTSTTGSSVLTLTAAGTATAGTTSVTVSGVSGTLSHTTTVSLTVTSAATPSFTLSASPGTLSIVQGASSPSTITVTGSGGFTGSVALATSGLPTGVTAAFSPASTTSSSVLTLTVAATAAVGTSTVTVTGTSGTLSRSTTVSLTVTAAGGTPTQLLGNTGFETGTAPPWSLSAGVLCSTSSCSGQTPHGGTFFAWLDGYGTTHTDTVSQTIAIPSGKTTATLSYFLHIDTAETTTTTAFDTLTVQVLNSSGTVLATLATFSNLNKATGYTVHTANMAAFIGQTVTIKFTGKEDTSLQTSFVLDDITLTVQ
jgi:subtilase family serine protease